MQALTQIPVSTAEHSATWRSSPPCWWVGSMTESRVALPKQTDRKCEPLLLRSNYARHGWSGDSVKSPPYTHHKFCAPLHELHTACSQLDIAPRVFPSGVQISYHCLGSWDRHTRLRIIVMTHTLWAVAVCRRNTNTGRVRHAQ